MSKILHVIVLRVLLKIKLIFREETFKHVLRVLIVPVRCFSVLLFYTRIVLFRGDLFNIYVFFSVPYVHVYYHI